MEWLIFSSYYGVYGTLVDDLLKDDSDSDLKSLIQGDRGHPWYVGNGANTKLVMTMSGDTLYSGVMFSGGNVGELG